MAISNQLTNYSSFKYVVTGSQPGPFHTIQSALDYVQALGETTTILVRPGTYTENLTLYNGINIQGSEEGQVIVIGTHVPPIAGTFSITQCTLQSLTDIFSTVAVGTCNIVIENCTLDVKAGYVFNMLNWLSDLRIDNCLEMSTANDILNNTGGSFIEILNSTVGTAGGTGMVSSGVVRIINSRIFCAMAIDAAATIDGSTIGSTITVTGLGDVSINNSFLDTGAAIAVTATTAGQITISDTTINSSLVNVITGTSDVELASVTFLDGEGIAGVTVLTNSEFRCNQAYATEAMTILKGDFNLIDGLLNINGSTGTDGQLIIASTAGKPAFASLTAGAGIGLTLGSNSIAIAATGALPVVWSAMAADAGLAVNTGRINTKPGALLTATLPAAAAVGTVIQLQGSATGSTGWKIAQNAGQNVQLGNTSTTIGVGGSLASTNVNDGVSLVCTVADTTWNAFASIGNITGV